MKQSSGYLITFSKVICSGVLFPILSTVLSLTNIAHAETTWNALTFDFPPYAYEGTDGKPMGIMTDIFTEMTVELKKDKKFSNVPSAKILPFKRAFEEASTNKNILLFPMGITPEREKLFDWIGPKFTRQVWIYSLDSNKDASGIKTLSDLKGKVIGVTKDYAWKKDIVAQEGIPEEGVSDIAVVKKMIEGRTPYVAVDEFAIKYIIGKIEEESKEKMKVKFKKVILLTGEGSRTFGIGKSSDPDLIKALRASFKKIESDGTIEKIKQKWLN